MNNKLFCLLGALLLPSAVYAQTISQEQVLVLAKEIAVVKALYELNDGALKSCIEAKVLETCDSDWVTCIEDAWVVKFSVSEACITPKNEQLGVTLLMDNKTGKVISHYPEIEYFKNAQFCRDDHDCLAAADECTNFIYALAQDPGSKQEPNCFCQNSSCTIEAQQNKE